MAAVFTYSTDDGHPSDMRIADLLSKNKVNGTFYIPVSNCEGRDVLSQQLIREIGSRFEIGSHTYDHYRLKNLTVADARYQIIEGKKQLENMLGTEVVGFCYPGGKYHAKHLEIVKTAGFQYARTTMNLCFDAGSNPYEMSTTFQFYPHDRTIYLRNYVKNGNWSMRHEGLWLALNQSNWIDRLYCMFDWSCQHNTMFHLWSHSWEIDALNAWQELDAFLAYVASRVPLEDRLSNLQLAVRCYSDVGGAEIVQSNSLRS
ncbi:MAG: polysaccharide deacetylase family protein [Glaciimonas sp.]|nr:polysaccharide deacetylase family protein [Glaciimonas sp.]